MNQMTTQVSDNLDYDIVTAISMYSFKAGLKSVNFNNFVSVP